MKPSDWQHTQAIMEILEERYGVAENTPHFDPLKELVACILSQHTSDINSGRAFQNLVRLFPTWEAVLYAPTETLANAIRIGGLADTKAVRIQQVLQRILEDQGTLSLEALITLTDSEARQYLMSLPGVGPKTAAIVLCFALGRPVIPVDTHIFRVSWRLGLVQKRIGEAKAHDVMQAKVAPEYIYRFHVAIIQHGRKVCKAVNPHCHECPLTKFCPTYQESAKAHPAPV
jgi:endonuclease-3